MAEINTAHRVCKILEDAVRQHHNQPTAHVWKKIFGINEPDDTRTNFEIARCLGQLFDEIDVIEKCMQETRFPSELYKPYMNNARQAIVPNGLNSGWNSFNSYLSPDTILCFKYCSEILPKDEIEIDEKLFSEVHEILDKLEETIDLAPVNIRRIIVLHTSKIREAIYSYNIVGAKALKEVVRGAYGELIESHKVLNDSKQTEQVKMLSALWLKIQQVADVAIKADDSISAGVGLFDRGVKAIGFIERFFP